MGGASGADNIIYYRDIPVQREILLINRILLFFFVENYFCFNLNVLLKNPER